MNAVGNIRVVFLKPVMVSGGTGEVVQGDESR